MAGLRPEASAFRRAIIARLRECAPATVDWTSWTAQQSGLTPARLRQVLNGGEPLTLDLADQLLRASCDQSLLDLAVEVDRISQFQDRSAEP